MAEQKMMEDILNHHNGELQTKYEALGYKRARQVTIGHKKKNFYSQRGKLASLSKGYEWTQHSRTSRLHQVSSIHRRNQTGIEIFPSNYNSYANNGVNIKVPMIRRVQNQLRQFSQEKMFDILGFANQVIYLSC